MALQKFITQDATREDAMDPLNITSAILAITKKCCSTASVLHEIRTKYKDAPTTITSICSQTTVISASLSQLQYLILRRDDLSAVLERRPDLASALDCSLIGCVMLFSCLDEEVTRVTKVAQTSNFNWRGKSRILWHQETLRQMLEDLRSQQAALSTLINLLQADSMTEMKTLLESNRDTFERAMRRTSTLRKSRPNVKIRKSIYEQEDEHPDDSFTIPPASPADPSSPSQPSEFQFDFENLVKNSRVYQQMLAKDKIAHEAFARNGAKATSSAAEGDLIDFSDEQVAERETDGSPQNTTLQQLMDLNLSEGMDNESQGGVTLGSAYSAPQLDLPEDLEGTLGLTSTYSDFVIEHRAEELPSPPLARSPSDEDLEEAPSPDLSGAEAEEKQVSVVSTYDPANFNALIPADEMTEEGFNYAIIPATPSAIQTEFTIEPDDSDRNASTLQDPSRSTLTSRSSNYSSSSRFDARRYTSSLEVDFSDRAGSPTSSTEPPPAYYPPTRRQGTLSPAGGSRTQQTSPTPSTSSQSYYRAERVPSQEVYPRPEMSRNPSSHDTTASHDSTPANPSPNPNSKSNTLRKPFFKRRASATQTCYRCKGSLTGTFVSAMGVAFHHGCFRCADCAKMLESTAFPFKRRLEDGTIETIPLCEKDYFQRLDPICRQCGNPLSGDFLAAFDTSHNKKNGAERFACGGCAKVFTAPYKYYQLDGRVYC